MKTIPIALAALCAGFSMQAAAYDASEAAIAPEDAQEVAAVPVEAYETVVVPKSMEVVRFIQDSIGASAFMQGTELAEHVSGTAELWHDPEGVSLWVEIDGVKDPRLYGKDAHSLILWAVTPEGNSSNLGEFTIAKNRGRIEAKTPLRSFGLMVAVEPNFAAMTPSSIVLAKAVFPYHPQEGVESFTASADGLVRGAVFLRTESGGEKGDITVPLELAAARNAVARLNEAQGNLPAQALSQAELDLMEAESHYNAGRLSQAAAVSRTVVQLAEEKRQKAVSENLALLKQENEQEQRWEQMTDKLKLARLSEEADGLRDALAAKASEDADFISMASVFFTPGGWTLSAEMENRLRMLLSNFPEGAIEVTIKGHTDATGSPEVNEKLSRMRAREVEEFLRAEGITVDAIEVQGLGDLLPVAPNATPEGRQQNRRVDIQIRKAQ